jgi:TolB-like protein
MQVREPGRVSGSQTYVFDRFRLQTSRHELCRDGKPLTLEPKAFAVLTELLAHEGELLERDRLLDTVWGHRHVTPGVLSRSIAQLRRALGDDSEHPRYIQTVHALGYRFIAPVQHTDDVPTRPPQTEAKPPAVEVTHGAIPLAVLPFANMSDDSGQTYFSDGICEDIITELSRWRMLAVRSRAASFRYRGAALDVRQVARELQVRFIVEGSIRRAGDRVRITVQLIDAETSNHVWAEKFDRVLADIFAVQDEVVRTIVSTLVGRMQACDIERARRKPPSSLAAYECVLKGNALRWDDPEERDEAARLFELAITLDPDYGFAHALLAAMRYGEWYEDPIGEDTALDEAFALATRGVELDPDESTCHSILAQVHHLRREFDLCLQHIQRSVELNPTNQWNTADMGMMLNYAGRAEEALAWFQRALEVDPYFDEPWYWREYGIALLLRQRYAEAVVMFNRLPVRHYRVAALRAASFALMGDGEHARLDIVECLAERPDFSIRHFLAKFPFREPADAELVARGMQLAGLPK